METNSQKTNSKKVFARDKRICPVLQKVLDVLGQSEVWLSISNHFQNRFSRARVDSFEPLDSVWN